MVHQQNEKEHSGLSVFNATSENFIPLEKLPFSSDNDKLKFQNVLEKFESNSENTTGILIATDNLAENESCLFWPTEALISRKIEASQIRDLQRDYPDAFVPQKTSGFTLIDIESEKILPIETAVNIGLLTNEDYLAVTDKAALDPSFGTNLVLFDYDNLQPRNVPVATICSTMDAEQYGRAINPEVEVSREPMEIEDVIDGPTLVDTELESTPVIQAEPKKPVKKSLVKKVAEAKSSTVKKPPTKVQSSVTPVTPKKVVKSPGQVTKTPIVKKQPVIRRLNDEPAATTTPKTAKTPSSPKSPLPLRSRTKSTESVASQASGKSEKQWKTALTVTPEVVELLLRPMNTFIKWIESNKEQTTKTSEDSSSTLILEEIKTLSLESEIRVGDEVKQWLSGFLQKNPTLVPAESAQKIRSKMQEMQKKFDQHKRQVTKVNSDATRKKRASVSEVDRNEPFLHEVGEKLKQFADILSWLKCNSVDRLWIHSVDSLEDISDVLSTKISESEQAIATVTSLLQWSEDFSKSKLHPILKELNSLLKEKLEDIKKELNSMNDFLHAKQADLIKSQAPLNSLSTIFKQIEKLLNGQIDQKSFNAAEKLIEKSYQIILSFQDKFSTIIDKQSLNKVLQPFTSEIKTKTQLIENAYKEMLIQSSEDSIEKESLDLLTDLRTDMEKLDLDYKELISDPPESKDEVLTKLKHILTNLETVDIELTKSILSNSETGTDVLTKAVKSKLSKVKTRVQRLFSQTIATVLNELSEDQLTVRGKACMTISMNKLGSWRPLKLNWDYLVSVQSQIRVIAAEIECYKESCDKYDETAQNLHNFDSQITSHLVKLDSVTKISHQMKLLTRRAEIANECRVAITKIDLEAEIETMASAVEEIKTFVSTCEQLINQLESVGEFSDEDILLCSDESFQALESKIEEIRTKLNSFASRLQLRLNSGASAFSLAPSSFEEEGQLAELLSTVPTLVFDWNSVKQRNIQQQVENLKDALLQMDEMIVKCRHLMHTRENIQSSLPEVVGGKIKTSKYNYGKVLLDKISNNRSQIQKMLQELDHSENAESSSQSVLSEIEQNIKEIEEIGMSIAASSPVTETRTLDSLSTTMDQCQANCIALGVSLILMSEASQNEMLETTMGTYMRSAEKFIKLQILSNDQTKAATEISKIGSLFENLCSSLQISANQITDQINTEQFPKSMTRAAFEEADVTMSSINLEMKVVKVKLQMVQNLAGIAAQSGVPDAVRRRYALESEWTELEQILDEKRLQLSEGRSEFDDTREDIDLVTQWLKHSKEKVKSLSNLHLDTPAIDSQSKVTKKLQKECSSWIETIESHTSELRSFVTIKETTEDTSNSTVTQSGIFNRLDRIKQDLLDLKASIDMKLEKLSQSKSIIDVSNAASIVGSTSSLAADETTASNEQIARSNTSTAGGSAKRSRPKSMELSVLPPAKQQSGSSTSASKKAKPIKLKSTNPREHKQ